MFRFILRPSCFCVALMLVVGVTTPAAHAVVISSASEIANLRAPANDPGWLNIGTVAGGTGVYLGNRWVITAGHVNNGNFVLTDGRVLAESIGSSRTLKNTGLPGTPDLRMFRLVQDPGLPALSVATTAPTVGTQVMMIGSGTDRAAQLRGWGLTNTPFGVQWTEVSPPSADVLGYSLAGDGPMRWGLNIVSAGSAFRPSDSTQVFMTTFDRNGVTFEAQATPGDSGGAVFIDSDTQPLLAGIIITNQPLNGQPANTVTFGSQTAMADLAYYSQQINSMVSRAEPLWQNQVNNYDVNGNGRADTRDALAIINRLLEEQDTLDLSGPRPNGDLWYDVTGDYIGNGADLLGVFNRLLAQAGQGPQASALAASPAADPMALPLGEISIVPEPATGALAVLAMAAGLFMIGKRRRN